MKYIYLLLILLSIKSFGQERNKYKLRLMVSETNVFPLTVINKTTQDTITTDIGGYFSMNLKESDELILQENEYYRLKYRTRISDLTNKIIRIYPESKSTLLEEVEVQTVSAKSLGIDSKTIMENTYNANPNMDFKAIFLWLTGKMKKKKIPVNKVVLRHHYEMNPYVAGLPRSFITDYLKIPEELVEKFYYFMNDDYEVDEYIKQDDRPKWEMHLLDKSFEFLKKEEELNR